MLVFSFVVPIPIFLPGSTCIWKRWMLISTDFSKAMSMAFTSSVPIIYKIHLISVPPPKELCCDCTKNWAKRKPPLTFSQHQYLKCNIIQRGNPQWLLPTWKHPVFVLATSLPFQQAYTVSASGPMIRPQKFDHWFCSQNSPMSSEADSDDHQRLKLELKLEICSLNNNLWVWSVLKFLNEVKSSMNYEEFEFF